MKYSISILSLVLVFMAIAGCRKKKNTGLGGNNELQITCKHHTIVLDSMKVYLKFNAQDAPEQISEYDLSEKVQDYNSEKLAIITGLKDGEYYLYGEGWDPNLPGNVKGGLPIELDNETNPIDIDLQVTEDGH